MIVGIDRVRSGRQPYQAYVRRHSDIWHRPARHGLSPPTTRHVLNRFNTLDWPRRY
jgi:hypothetical protein